MSKKPPNIRIVRPPISSVGGPLPRGDLRGPVPSPSTSIRPPPPPSDDQLTLDAIRESTRAPRKAPANKDLMDRSAAYATELPSLLRTASASVREFFLTEALPLLSAVSAGMSDGKDVVKMTLSEEPDSARFQKMMEDLAVHALRIKTVSFLSAHFKLTRPEELLFRMVDYSLTSGLKNGDDIQSVLREMLALPGVQRPEKSNAKVQVRQVHPPKGSGQSARPAVRRDGASGRKRSTE